MRRSIFVMAAVVAFSAVTTALVAGESNWVSRLGRLAQNTDGVRGTMEQVDAPYKQEFAARLLRAANTLPLKPDEKNTRIARIAHELVAGAKTVDEKIATLSTIFTKTAPMYLSGVADTLSAGLEVGRNGLSQANFLNIATNVIADVERRTAGEPDHLLRVTMTIATFLRAAGTTLDLEPLLAALSDSGLAALIRPVVGAAVKGDYAPMLQANADENTGGANKFVDSTTVAVPSEALFFVPRFPGVGVGGVGVEVSGGNFKGVDARPLDPQVGPPPCPPGPYSGQCILPPLVPWA